MSVNGYTDKERKCDTEAQRNNTQVLKNRIMKFTGKWGEPQK